MDHTGSPFYEFMSFVGFVSSIDTAYYICGDFNFHVDIPGSDGKTFLNLIALCILKQLVSQPTHLHGHILDFILSPNDLDATFCVKISELDAQ